MPLFRVLVGVGFVVSVLVVFRLVAEQALARAAGGFNPYLAVGTLGTLASAAMFASGGTVIRDDTPDAICEKRSSLPALLHHSARETAFVTVWVAVAYLGYTWIVTLTGLDPTGLRSIGFVGVVAGALVGLIPGCAPQIVPTGLNVQGGLPFPTLLANALSQDGEPCFPSWPWRPARRCWPASRPCCPRWPAVASPCWSAAEPVPGAVAGVVSTLAGRRSKGVP
ncbi:MAG: putative manganese transporter [Actinomycetota bacterium]|nr:putative manganese transporter [Actinomycetota bacterium]